MLSKLSVVSLSISGLLMLSVLTLATTSAYAQSQGRSNNQACPEGFELNKGVCQAEPELECPPSPTSLPIIDVSGLVPEEYGGDDVQCVERHRADLEEECPPRTFENQDGTGCEVRENNSPTGAVIDVVPKIWVCQGGTILNPLDSSYCIWIVPQETTIYDKVSTCDIGTLNEASGMCEVKPGNRGSNRA